MKQEIKAKKLHLDAIIPKRNNPTDSGLDLHALEDTLIKKDGSTSLVKTGISFEIPPGYEVQVRPRSGISLKTGMRISNAPGTVDSSYRGDCSVLIYSCDSKEYLVKKGDRIAQAVIVPVMLWDVLEVGELPSSERGDSGFGSSGS